jgi:hypothetical protein
MLLFPVLAKLDLLKRAHLQNLLFVRLQLIFKLLIINERRNATYLPSVALFASSWVRKRVIES